MDRDVRRAAGDGSGVARRRGDALHADALAVERDRERRRLRSRRVEDEPAGNRAAADRGGERLQLEPAGLQRRARLERLQRKLVGEHEPADRELGVGVELPEGFEGEGRVAEDAAVPAFALGPVRPGEVDLRRCKLRAEERPRAVGLERGAALDRALAERELERVGDLLALAGSELRRERRRHRQIERHAGELRNARAVLHLCLEREIERRQRRAPVDAAFCGRACAVGRRHDVDRPVGGLRDQVDDAADPALHRERLVAERGVELHVAVARQRALLEPQLPDRERSASLEVPFRPPGCYDRR
jgi:hypothetical protein